jgi:hypothetical protein
LPLQGSLIGWVTASLYCHVGRAGAEVGTRCRDGDGFALQREPRKDKEVAPYEDGQGNPAQAATAERVAVNTADTYVANQMRTLAQAFRTQAEIIKKNKKKKKK